MGIFCQSSPLGFFIDETFPGLGCQSCQSNLLEYIRTTWKQQNTIHEAFLNDVTHLEEGVEGFGITSY